MTASAALALPRSPLAQTEAVLAADFVTLGGLGQRTGRVVLQLLRRRLRQIASDVAEFDARVAAVGPAIAMRELAEAYGSEIKLHGEARPPAEGPLLILANHPGIFDSFALFATAGRADLLGLARPQPLFGVLPAMRRHLILLPDAGPGRARAARGVLRHLGAAGAAFVFPAGALEPEPTLPGDWAEPLGPWLSGSAALVRLAARHHPDLLIQTAAISGVISRQTWTTFRLLIALRRGAPARRDLATLLQIVLPRLGRTRVEVRYGEPRSARRLIEARSDDAALARDLRAELTGLLAGG